MLQQHHRSLEFRFHVGLQQGQILVGTDEMRSWFQGNCFGGTVAGSTVSVGIGSAEDAAAASKRMSGSIQPSPTTEQHDTAGKLFFCVRFRSIAH